MDVLFAPPDESWTRVSPRLRLVRFLVVALLGLVTTAAVVVVAVLGAPPGWFLPSALAAVAVAVGAGLWWSDRSVRRWGYAELDQELWITRGALFRRLVVVPYGRMQFVDVNAGPVDQLNGIAKVQLHTASPGTTAVIPGLPAAEAARLRDRLTTLGESRAAGL
jgi:membrane protein YdbS with pleckstrin-like domain